MHCALRLQHPYNKTKKSPIPFELSKSMETNNVGQVPDLPTASVLTTQPIKSTFIGPHRDPKMTLPRNARATPLRQPVYIGKVRPLAKGAGGTHR